MAGPSESEVKIVIRYLLEGQGELTKVETGLATLADMMRKVFAEGSQADAARFITTLRTMATETEKAGKSMSDVDTFMVAALRSMADEMESSSKNIEKHFVKVRETLSTAFKDIGDDVKTAAKQIDDFGIATKSAIDSGSLERIDVLKASLSELSEEISKKGTLDIVDTELLGQLDQFTAQLDAAAAEISNLVDRGQSLTEVSESLTEADQSAEQLSETWASMGDDKAIRNMAKGTDDLNESSIRLVGTYDKVFASEQRLIKNKEDLSKLYKDQKINTEQYLEGLKRVTAQHEQLTNAEGKQGGMLEKLTPLLGKFVGHGAAGGLLELITVGFKAVVVLELLHQYFEHLKEAIPESAQSQALARGLETIGTNAGYTAEQIKHVREEVEALNITSNVTAQTLSRLTASQVPLEQSLELAKAAKQLATTYGLSVEQAFEQTTNAVLRKSTMFFNREFGKTLDAQRVFLEKSRELGRPLLPSEETTAFSEAITKMINDMTQGVTKGTPLQIESLQRLTTAYKKFKEDIESISGRLAQPFIDALGRLLERINKARAELDERNKEREAATKEAVVESEFGATVGGAATSLIQRRVSKEQAARNAASKDAERSARAAGAEADAAHEKAKHATAEVKALTEQDIAAIEQATLKMGTAVLKAAADRGADNVARIKADNAQVEALDQGRLSRHEISEGQFYARQKQRRTQEHEATLAFMVQQREALRDARDQARLNTQDPTAFATARSALESHDNAIKVEQQKFVADMTGLTQSAITHAVTTAKQITEAELNAQLETMQVLADMHKKSNATLETLDQQHYNQSLLSFDTYYDRRRERLEQELANDLLIAEKEKANADARIKLAATEGEAAVRQAQESAKVAALRLTAARQSADAQRAQETAARSGADFQRLQAGIAVQLQYQRSVNELDLDTRIAEIDRAFVEQARTIDASKVKWLELKRTQDIAKATFDATAEAIRRETDAQQSAIDVQAAYVDVLSSRGLVTEFERQSALNELIRQRIALEVERVRKTQEALDRAKALGDQDTRTQQEALNRAQANVIQLQASMRTAGDQIRENFTNALAAAFDALGNRVKTLKEIVKDFALTWLRSIQQMLSQNAAQEITKLIVNATSSKSGDNGIFGSLGKLLGLDKADGSTKAKALWVKDAGSTSSGSTTSTAGGRGSIASTFEEDPITGEMVERINESTDTVTDGFTTYFSKNLEAIGRGLSNGEFGLSLLFSSLRAGIMEVFNSLTTGSGSTGGGFFGLLVKLGIRYFTGGVSGTVDTAGQEMGYAEGGLIGGPSHARGGVPIEAEGGEFITRVSQTARWLPLLHAINTGALDRLHLASPMRGYHFAAGGQVPTEGRMGGGNTITNNVNIKVDTTTGETSAQGTGIQGVALGRALSSVVQAELQRQMLPGGLLS